MSFVHPLYEVGGTDISNYQYPVTWVKLLPRIQFGIARIGDAAIVAPEPMIDTTYPGYMMNFRMGKKPRGAYYYFRPEYSIDKQLYAVQEMTKNDWPEMGVHADLENNDHGFSRKEYSARARHFVVGIDSMVPPDAGESTGVYSSIAFWNQNIDPSYIPFLDTRPKWLALVPTNIIYPARPWAYPNGWNNQADLWQFNWGGGALYKTPGRGKEWGVSSYGLDLNVYLGTAQQFYRRYNIMPEESTVVASGFIATAKINMRPIPSDAIGTRLLGQLYPANTIVPVYKTELDKKGRGLWYQISGDSQYEIWIASWVGGKTIYQT